MRLVEVGTVVKHRPAEPLAGTMHAGRSCCQCRGEFVQLDVVALAASGALPSRSPASCRTNSLVCCPHHPPSSTAVRLSSILIFPPASPPRLPFRAGDVVPPRRDRRPLTALPLTQPSRLHRRPSWITFTLRNFRALRRLFGTFRDAQSASARLRRISSNSDLVARALARVSHTELGLEPVNGAEASRLHPASQTSEQSTR
ncbi:uncharacterized protein B0H18DRAFT_675225 [Fomitopsis serialis]|uniref:uncharacterized protein n=1 Tax=Fomitopsis serialis TaxID=139415 RepID=UPI0020072B04|nr:uncharacterized protein B0H18DRAFT_675225 [Neoantrodia serialis]KAH9933043.1 hypothetical protein B0H18DRAFT_675225 [Neoantrodia serialis]